MGYDQGSSKERWGSAAFVVLLHAGVGLMLINAFGINAESILPSAILNSFNIDAPTPEVAAVPLQAEKAVEEEGATSAANMKKKPVVTEAPKPIVKPPKTRPAAPKSGKGPDSDAGAALNPGPGTGGGGAGTGIGSGQSGSGSGAGGAGGNGGGVASRARLISGKITNKDYPKSASRAKEGGTVETRFTVDAGGRARQCRVVRSSGNSDIDAATCRLIEERFRYTPARNKAGDAISDVSGWKQTWWLERGKRVIQRPQDDEPKPPPIYVPPPSK